MYAKYFLKKNICHLFLKRGRNTMVYFENYLFIHTYSYFAGFDQ